MIKTDHVRAQAAVRDFDFTEKLAEFGFSTGTRADIDTARALVADMIKNADSDMERIIRDCDELGQNPYKRSVNVNGQDFKVAMELPLFADAELSARINRAFSGTKERPNVPKPDRKIISQRVTEGIVALLEDAGYRVCGVEHNRDGSPMRIVLQDPVYAAEAAEQRGDTPVVRNIAAAGSTLREIISSTDKEMSAEALGLRPAVTAEQVLTVRGVVREIVERAEHDLMLHIQTLKLSGVSPYAAGKVEVGAKWTVVEYVDKSLAPWRFKRYVDKPIVIESINDRVITNILEARLPGSSSVVEHSAFCHYVRRALVERLRGVHDLPLAAVTRHYSSPAQVTIMLVAPDAFARSRQNILRRLIGGKPAAPLVLPAPTPQPSLAVVSPDKAPATPHTTSGFAVPQ